MFTFIPRTSEVDQWERPRSEFQLWRKMGEGCFGEVWEGMWKNTVPVAIKIMKQADMRDDFVKEIRNLKSLKHTRLIKLLAVCSVGEPVYIVTELMRKGNLHSYLNSLKFENALQMYRDYISQNSLAKNKLLGFLGVAVQIHLEDTKWEKLGGDIK
ncbi:PREDICTED: tyrosine-protein kinase Srms-like [Thamnophis sirtalis]|uniref:non-specific protein-tyrosine kinase n=1 Tax=Thamnophis sirtalis TaxID=35019 RepID=A0A6I9XTT6_9SAUR|nr:PREDICTED: tyrosine-protein kinase Srms-like [Thamnophis sirtalis]